MKILITNDDGVRAEGIIALANAFAPYHEVTVAAPDRERSACGRSMTLDVPLTARALSIPAYHKNCTVYSVSGTPTDCVKLGAQELLQRDVDLVLSGINVGSNLGTDIAYSGTVNAALEGCMLGYPSIAFSQVIHPDAEDISEFFRQSAAFALDIVGQLGDPAFLGDHIYNINFPLAPKDRIAGLVVCPQGLCNYEEKFEKRVDPFGREYYWPCGKMQHCEYNDIHQTDIYWVEKNYITITPLHWDNTETSKLEDAKCRISSMKLHF